MNPSRPHSVPERASDDAGHAARTLDLAAISHELRTPLQAIMAFSQLAQQEWPADVDRRYLEQIDQASRLMLRVVNDILDLSKLSQGTLEIQREQPLDLQRLISQVYATAEGLRQGPGVSLYLDLIGVNNLYLRGDARRIEQILLNLMGNALRSTDLGMVRLGARLLHKGPQRATVRIYVADTGVGMPLQVLDTLLMSDMGKAEPFDRSTRGGSGYGIKVVRHLLALMDSALQGASVQGGGTLMWFDLSLPVASTPEGAATPAGPVGMVWSDNPLFVRTVASLWQGQGIKLIQGDWRDVKAQPGLAHWVVDASYPQVSRALAAGGERGLAALLLTAGPAVAGQRTLSSLRQLTTAQAGPIPDVTPLQSLQVLVVDDNLLNLEAIRAQLTQMGVQVQLAQTCKQARALMLAHPLDAVFFDVQLPDGSGLALAQWLRQQPVLSALPFGLLSAHISAEDQAHARSLGALACLLKPHDPEDLLSLLRQVAARRKALPAGKARAQAGLRALSGVDLRDLFRTEWPRLRRELADAQDAPSARRAVHAIRGSLAVLGQSPELHAAKSLEERLTDGPPPDRDELDRFQSEVEKMLDLPPTPPG